jgi:hypothetical protein
MSSALPVSPSTRRKASLIWLGDVDPDGHPLQPSIRELAYQKETELARYRASEMTDEAEIASLIEEAVYRTSKAASERAINDPASYLFRTYTNLVDRALQRTVKAFGMESQLLAQIAKSEDDSERALVRGLTRQEVIESMDEKGRGLWERHILGYELEELAAEEGQTADYLGKRLRRAAERALRRLFSRTAGDR